MTASWIIQPRDGMAVRDGRPNDGRSQSRSMAFPLPQTVAGAVRTRLGSQGGGAFSLDPEVAKAIEVAGPLLLRRRLGSSQAELLLPAPGDALWAGSRSGERRDILPLVPLYEEIHRGGDVPSGVQSGLNAVGLPSSAHLPGKPPLGTPAFWTWNHLRTWLLGEPLSADEVYRSGERGLEQDQRVHVAIDPQTGTYVEGALFGEPRLTFRSQASRALVDVSELSLTFKVGSNPSGRELQGGIGHMGGKNLLLTFEQAERDLWPECPPELLDHVGKTGASAKIRLVLATPGIFDLGWLPTHLLHLPDADGVTVHIRAAKVDRPLTLSGWDYAAGSKDGRTGSPKPTRRAVPSGAVYWLELEGPQAHRQEWLKNRWLKSIADSEQDRRDGFGLAVMGVWR